MEYVHLALSLLIAHAYAVENSCYLPCPKPQNPVCGNDGTTYPGDCDMRVQACLRKQAIIIIRKGKCPAEGLCKLACAGTMKPECGSDGKFYANECKRKEASCNEKKAIVFVRPAFPEGDDCSDCNLACSKDYQPVCASDGKTYTNGCQMRLKSCTIKTAIIRIFNGAC